MECCALSSLFFALLMMIIIIRLSTFTIFVIIIVVIIIIVIVIISNIYSSVTTSPCTVLQLNSLSLPLFSSKNWSLGFLALTALITVTGGYWWNVIIPAKRTELAISKRKGKYRRVPKCLAKIKIIKFV